MNVYQRLWWQQAQSDHSVLVLLRRHGAAPCHQLHYLQMTTEKLGKAYFWRSGKPPDKNHMIAPVAVSIFGRPRVTLINATGYNISKATIALGDARREVGELKDGQSLTAQVYGRFGASATHVAWTDSRGRHEAIADDYMENYGFYHTTVVLTPDAKAKAIYSPPGRR